MRRICMPRIKITINVDEQIGDVSMTIDEVQANGITISHG